MVREFERQVVPGSPSGSGARLQVADSSGYPIEIGAPVVLRAEQVTQPVVNTGSRYQ